MRTRTGCLGQMDGIGSHALLDEIEARLQRMAHAAHQRGEVLLPPLLVLGTCERVGSNWISDTLRPVLGQHNEPFRQQLAGDHPLSPLNPRLTGFSGGDLPTLGHLGRHWLVTFAISKYGLTRQAVKETNLFFAMPALLALLPGAPVLVLSRSPLGVASSFTRSRLFARWGYGARYQQMIAMTRYGSGCARRFSALVPDDDPPDLVALARLHVLNTVLLADALAGLVQRRRGRWNGVNGHGNLLLLDGRARLTAAFVEFARICTPPARTEPKLALTIAAYATSHPVHIIETLGDVTDLGALAASHPDRAPSARDSGPRRQQVPAPHITRLRLPGLDPSPWPTPRPHSCRLPCPQGPVILHHVIGKPSHGRGRRRRGEGQAGRERRGVRRAGGGRSRT